MRGRLVREDAMELAAFADPWEHARLLSDETRNAALLELLRRHARDAVVLEVGCGTGLWSLIAARMGARKVYAVEATAMHEVAQALVERNGLGDVIEVLPGVLEDHAPRPVDLAFSELLNADPFTEGLIPTMQQAARWTGPRGRLAPRRLVVKVALAQAADSAKEVRDAAKQVRALASAYALRLDPLVDAIHSDAPYKYLTTLEAPISSSAVAFDLKLGEEGELEDRVEVEVEAHEPGPVSGAICWFEAEYDEGIAVDNRPGAPTHWGQLVCGWSRELGVKKGERIRLVVERDGDELEIFCPAALGA